MNKFIFATAYIIEYNNSVELHQFTVEASNKEEALILCKSAIEDYEKALCDENFQDYENIASIWVEGEYGDEQGWQILNNPIII